MAEAKTKPTEQSVDTFIDNLSEEQVKADCKTLVKLMSKITGAPPKMWGSSIIGFGTYHYKYSSGHEGDSCLAGFSPRKQNITIYAMLGIDDFSDLLNKLGKHKTGKGCLYIKRLSDVDLQILEKVIKRSVAFLKKSYPVV